MFDVLSGWIAEFIADMEVWPVMTKSATWLCMRSMRVHHVLCSEVLGET